MRGSCGANCTATSCARRTIHSRRHFLDACDELGLLVLEEIPGWQHIGDKAWQDVAVRNVGEMIRRDWNHPSIVLWGVRINESAGQPRFLHAHQRARPLARRRAPDRRHPLPLRTELLEDVMTMNDFGFPLRPPNHPLYMNTEFDGHMFSTKRSDNVERVAEHVTRHARVHDQLASDNRYAGGTGWCAFDYNTHHNFGSGDHICYHGVSDIFRIPNQPRISTLRSAARKKKSFCRRGFSRRRGTGRPPAACIGCRSFPIATISRSISTAS